MSVTYAIIIAPNNERLQMIKVEHYLKFVTEFDETHPSAIQLLALGKDEITAILEGLLKDHLLPTIQPTIDELNDGTSWAKLKAVK
jgi:hypothetical protein